MKQLFFLTALCVILGLAYVSLSEGEKTPNHFISKFQIKDLASIARIEIDADQFEDMTFVKMNNHWTLQRAHKARENAMQNMLEVFEHLSIKYIPQEAARENIQRDMREIGIEVKAFDIEGNTIKHYIIGSSTADERGTYVRLADEQQAYVTHLTTLEGSVRGRFIMRYDEWRDRQVFRDPVDQIQIVELSYPRQQGESFRIEGDEVISESTNQRISAKAKVDQYKQAFTSVYAEAYENHNSNQDSIRQLLPFSIITYVLDNGERRQLKLYPVENYVNESLVTLKDTPRINRYFGDLSNGDFLLLQQRIVGKLLRGFSYFENE